MHSVCLLNFPSIMWFSFGWRLEETNRFEQGAIFVGARTGAEFIGFLNSFSTVRPLYTRTRRGDRHWLLSAKSGKLSVAAKSNQLCSHLSLPYQSLAHRRCRLQHRQLDYKISGSILLSWVRGNSDLLTNPNPTVMTVVYIRLARGIIYM